jgi:DNA-binding NtrC family response regulator
MPTLLLVDDELSVLTALKRSLRRHFGSELAIELCSDASQALQRAHERHFDVVVADLRMPVMDGLAFLSRLGQVQPHAVTLMLTGSADFDTAQRAVNDVGVFRYLCKPWHDEELAAHMRAALDHARDNAQQRERADAWAASQGEISPQELERRRLESLEPGITQVEWGPGGTAIMPLD